MLKMPYNPPKFINHARAPLTAEEEAALAALVRAGREAAAALDGADGAEAARLEALVRAGREAEDRLIRAVLGWVCGLVGRQDPDEYFDYEELEQEALAILCQRLPLFDPARGRLTTFVAAVVRRHFLRVRPASRGTIRVPGNPKVRAAEKKRVRRICSIDDRYGTRLAENCPLRDALAEPRPAPDEEVAEAEERELQLGWLRRHLAYLPPRRRLVLERRFFDGWTLDEVGAQLGVCRERVRQIERAGLRDLRRIRQDQLPRPLDYLTRTYAPSAPRKRKKPLTFQEVRLLRLARICGILRREGPLSASELGRRLRLSSRQVAVLLHEYRGEYFRREGRQRWSLLSEPEPEETP